MEKFLWIFPIKKYRVIPKVFFFEVFQKELSVEFLKKFWKTILIKLPEKCRKELLKEFFPR